jgi:DMSO reductase family type II enzyme heme b subunit
LVRRVAYSAVALAALAWLAPAAAKVDERGYEIVPTEPVKASAEDVEQGKALYAAWCAQCHGENGDGKGIMADRVFPVPRDFTSGVYKLRHTFAGQLPTDSDLFDTISKGMPGTSMPAWQGALTEAEIRHLVAYVKTFSADFEKFPAEERVVVGKPVEATKESLERGKQVYDDLQCAKCHGDLGRGNGPSAEGLKDDWGATIWPADLTLPWTFRGGSRHEDIYRTLVTGLSGTPMPSYASAVTSEDAWHLVNYVASFGHAPLRDVVVRGARVPSIPDDPRAKEWEDAPASDFALAGQIIQDPRLFMPTHQNIRVKALHDGTDVAVLLIWDDRTQDTGGEGLFPDQAGVQFPSGSAPEGVEKPYFLMGDAKNAVDYWLWSAAADTVACLVAHGMDEAVTRTGRVRAHATYDDGRYEVILRRSLETGDDIDVRFPTGQFVPVAFHLWDGANGETGKRRSVSAWFYLLLEPETPRSVFAWPAAAVLVCFGAQVFLMQRLRRRS